jgi:hypothetical protein
MLHHLCGTATVEILMQSKPQQLAAAKRLLKEAAVLIADAKGLLQDLGELEAVQRLDVIRQRLGVEIDGIEQPPAAPS